MDGDERFAAVARDPRFHGIPRKERKVKVDKRFQSMFKDKRFKLKYSVDKRGRPMHQTSEENLKKFYEISDSDSDENKDKEEDDSDDAQNDAENKEGQKEKRGTNKSRRSGREYFKEILERRKMKLHDVTGKISDYGKRDKSLLPNSDYEVIPQTGVPENVQDHRSKKDSNSSSDSSDDESSDEETVKPDYSRGEVLMESSSSSSESESEDEPEFDLEHKWGEIDADAQRSEEVSSRLAVCNMDWDRVKAQDVMVLLNSFKPTDGIIRSVKIYPSEFGLQRMKEEDLTGPQELVETDPVYETLDGKVEEKYQTEKMRKYQMQRLKYYYAVVECDSPKTASSLYDQCDGYEYESSAVRMDLRFIPDDMTFDQDPKEVTEDLPDITTYEPSDFTNTALQQSKVELTWDEDDHHRIKLTTKAFEDDDLDNVDVTAYLASSESEEDDLEANADAGETDESTDEAKAHSKKGKGHGLEKYRQLVKELEEEEQAKENEDLEMEISWEPGLKETTEEIIRKKTEGEEEEKTPWQSFLEKKKEKRKQRREDLRKEKEKKEQAQGSDKEAFSDDDLPADVHLGGSFFKDSLKQAGSKTEVGKKKSKRKPKQEELTAEEKEAVKQNKAELELLMMDEDDNKQHFNLKSIMEQEKEGKNKKKKKRAANNDEKQTPDQFEMNVKDPRFQEVYTSHHFAIDPSDPQFKKTKAMEAILNEKQMQRIKGDFPKSQKTNNLQKGSLDNSKHELSALVKSVKRKTGQFNANKGKMPRVENS